MKLDVEVESRGLLDALDRACPAMERRLKAAADVTGHRIKAEALARVARRTGETAAGITVEDTHDGKGVVVYAATDPGNLDVWLEFGTEQMTARPFLWASAQLEVGPHDRRIREAINDAITEVGLGS